MSLLHCIVVAQFHLLVCLFFCFFLASNVCQLCGKLSRNMLH